MLGLYIHIPFCKKICSYCDFCKMVSSKNVRNNYLNALYEEMKLKKINNYQFDTLYIGGGTPSSLTIDELAYLFSSIEEYVDLKNLKEFTIECNPEDITDEFCKLIKKKYITRISIGIQTFNEDLQNIINRNFDFNSLKEKILLLRSHSFDNINIDMIYALPNQTKEMLDEDLNMLLQLDINHISYYSLILEKHTVLHHLLEKNKISLSSEKLENLMYHHICHILEKNGFKRYEISNFAKKGYQSLHNLIYWNCEEYIGLGLNSSSYYHNIRSTTTYQMKEYLQSVNNGEIALAEKNTLSKKDKMEEEVILGLRKKAGIDKKRFYNKYHLNIEDYFTNIPNLKKDGLLIEKNNHLSIPQKYVYITNHIILKII